MNGADKPKRRLPDGITFKQKLMLSFFLLIIVPLGVFTLISFANMRHVMEQRVLFSAGHSFDQTSDFIAYKIGKLIQISDVIALDIAVNNMLERDLETYALPDQYGDMNNLWRYLNSFFDEKDGIQVRMYVRDEVVYSREEVNVLGFGDAVKEGWYSRLNETSNKILMCPPAYLGGGQDDRYLSLVRRLRRSNDFQVTLAYVRIDFSTQRIRQILSDANASEGSLTYLQNSEGIVVAATDDALLDELMIQPQARQTILGGAGWELMNLQREDAFVKARAIPGTDWTMTTVIPTREIFSHINTQRNVMLLLLAGIGAMAYVAAALIAHYSTVRISRLARHIRTVHGGDLTNATLPVEGGDEISELTRDYNFMIDRMKELLDEQKKAGMEIKNAELRALQAQINPHFLYNTLDMINWMSYEERGEEIRTLVQSLSAFYKLSLNRGRDIVSIKDELAHVSFYARIQNIRLNDRVDLIADVEEACARYGIIKLTLQPIVENAIIHGIMNTEQKRGAIRIMGRLDGDTILLSVQDDGCGIAPERLHAIFSDEFEAQHNNGFGIRNIHDRLRLVYGPEYGLSIKSEHGRGTQVDIRIPAIEADEDSSAAREE